MRNFLRNLLFTPQLIQKLKLFTKALFPYALETGKSSQIS